jgi:hypothetical protein
MFIMDTRKKSIWEHRLEYSGIFSHYANDCFYYVDSDESQTDLITYPSQEVQKNGIKSKNGKPVKNRC